MAGFCRRLRHHATRAGFAVVTAFALVPWADAQWFPFGAAPPGEIVQRLRAEGYTLIRPLERRDTVYLADVAGGPAGHERLVLDAWSGEILQRFVARRGGFVPEGGEFSEPPPLGPPPAREFREGNNGYGSEGGEAPPLGQPRRDFREGNYGYGSEVPPGGGEAPPRARVRSRPAATARRGGEPKQTTPAAQPVEPRNAGTGSPGASPAAAAPTGAGAPATAASPAAAPANPANASSEPATGAQPKPGAPGSSPVPAQTQAKGSAQPAAPASLPASAEKPGGKKVNDVPVNPLD
jgi:hypothetical protein